MSVFGVFLVWMQKNADQKNSKYGHFSARKGDFELINTGQEITGKQAIFSKIIWFDYLEHQLYLWSRQMISIQLFHFLIRNSVWQVVVHFLAQLKTHHDYEHVFGDCPKMHGLTLWYFRPRFLYFMINLFNVGVRQYYMLL